MSTTTISTFNNLKMVAAFSDEDDRTITLPNPKPSLTKSEIDAVGALAVGVLIGDKYGAAFTRIKTASYVEGTITNIALD